MNTDNTERARARLSALYGADEEGTWAIHGEDPNCDMGGHHYEPHLETVTGKYGDAVDYALALPGFFGWGSGGSIRKVQVDGFKKIDHESIGQRAQLLSRRDALQKEIDDINAQL